MRALYFSPHLNGNTDDKTTVCIKEIAKNSFPVFQKLVNRRRNEFSETEKTESKTSLVLMRQ